MGLASFGFRIGLDLGPIPALGQVQALFASITQRLARGAEQPGHIQLC
jgi:hypothetical protein